MIESNNFTTLPQPEQIEVIFLRMGDLIAGKVELKDSRKYMHTSTIFGNWDDLDEYGNSAPYTKGGIIQLGFNLLPAETILHWLLQNGDKLKPGDVISAGMKPIEPLDSFAAVFSIGCDDKGLWLDNHFVDTWVSPATRFLLRNNLPTL